MFAPKRNAQKINPAFIFSILFLLVLLLQQSCKKMENTFNAPLHEADFAKHFFATKTTPNAIIAALIEKLKKENERTDFVNKLPANCGLPVWDKVLVYKSEPAELNTQTLTHGPAFNPDEMEEEENSSIIIPLTRSNEDLSSVIIADDLADTMNIRCFTTNEYLYNITHGTSVDTIQAMKELNFFFYMENQTFGTTAFYHIPANLYSNSRTIDADGNKTITIKNTEPPVSNVVINVCVTYNHCVGTSPCTATYCDGCNLCVSVDCTTVGTGGGGCTTIYCGNGGGGSGGGGTGGGGGGGGTPCSPLTSANPWYASIINPNPCNTPPATDSNGYYYSRIAELKTLLTQNPFALEPCDSLNLMPLDPINGYGAMWQQVAQFIPSNTVTNRLDSLRTFLPSGVFDNYNLTNLSDAYGSVVNCDFFPVRITQLPPGYTPESLIEYFRLNINSFIDGNINVAFSPYEYDNSGTMAPPYHFYDTAKFYANAENSLGALIHISMWPNDGSVVESDYFHNITNGRQTHGFKFSTLKTPVDYNHPVAGNREFGIYKSTDPQNPGDYVFYTMGVDRLSDWMFAFGDWLSGSHGFEKADKLWLNIQEKFMQFIISKGGQASYYSQKNIKARPKWEEVEKYLKNEQTWGQLKQKLGC